MKKIFLFFTFLALVFATSAQSLADDFYRQARQYDSLSNFEKAIEYYTKTIEVDSNFLNAYFNRGSILATEKKYELALNDFKTFDRISPDDFEVQYLMAACYYYLGDKATSLALVNKSLNGMFDFIDALKLRGTLYLEKGEYANAIKDFNNSLLTQFNDYEIYYMSGFCYEALNDSILALNNYLKAEDLGFKNEILFNNIGSLLVKLTDFENALKYFEKAIAINNNFALAYYNQGIANDQLGFRDSALKSWHKAQELGFTDFSDKIIKILNQY